LQFKFVNQSGDKSFLFDPVRAFSKDYNLIYILLLAVLIFSIRIFTGFNGLYGQDSYEYLRYADVLTEFFRNGNPPGEFFWPLAYPLFGSLLSLLIKDTILSLQLISIFSFIICFFYVIRILGIFYNRKDGKLFTYGLLFFAFSQ